MSLDLGLVVQSARRLLTEVTNAAAALGHEIPERRYITTGGSVYDCPQVTVSVNSIATGFAATASLGDAVGNCPPGWNAIFEAAIVRGAAEAPQGRRGQVAPAVADIEIDAAQSDADATVLTRAVELVAGPGWSQYGNVPAALQFGEVAGGLTAVVLTVTLNLWDFPPDPNAPPEPEPSP